MSRDNQRIGVNWLDSLPSSWKTTKVKYTALDNGLFQDGDWIDSDIITESGIRYLTTGNVGVGIFKEQGESYISNKTFQDLHCLQVLPNDILISRLNEPIGRACFAPSNEQEYVVAVDVVVLRPNKSWDKRFLLYSMNCNGYAENANLTARGSTMHRISRSQLGQFQIPHPNLEEQESIANYLDAQCAHLDRMIATIEKQIEVLNKYKKALITETVTKGLDKSAPMKDSGIAWFGEIPEHWRITKIKFCATKIGGGKTPLGGSEVYAETGIMFIRSQNVYDDGLRLDDIKFIDEQTDVEMKSSRVLQGDVLFNITGASIARCCIFDLSERANVNQHVCILRTNDLLESRYLRYLLNSDVGKNQTYFNQMGGNRDSLTFEQIGEFLIALPPIQEQVEMSEFLERRIQGIKLFQSKKAETLKNLKMMKQSLIFEYVTGKKRVKEVQ